MQFRRTIKKSLRRFGKDVVKARPRDTLEPVQLAMAYQLRADPDSTLVQAGACDGISNDPIHNLVKSNNITALLVEPIPYNFQKLKETYEGLERLQFLQAAISHHDGEQTIYCIDENIPKDYWSRGWASFERGHLLRLGVSSADIVEQTVQTITLSRVASMVGGQIDILVIDTEGFDGEVVKMALDLPRPPSVISFEHVHLPSQALFELCDLLGEAGFSWMFGSMNALCLQARVADTW